MPSCWCRVVLAALLAAQAAASAQRLKGVVRDSATGESIGGAVLSVSDSAGRFLARGIANADGQFAVFRLDGSARVSVIRIGFEPRTLAITARDTADMIVLMRPIPASLSVVTRTSRRVCPTDKGDSQALALWEQARAGLLAALIARESSTPRIDLLSFDRELEPIRKRLRDEHHETKSLTADQAYVAARPAAAFAEDGYVLDAPGGRTYFAPDETVLLHESFVETHCMRVVAGDGNHRNEIGIAFEPADLADRDTLVDIEGTLWIDQRKPALRSVDFEYTRIEPDAKGAGGQLLFQTMPTGTAIIVRWVIHFPDLVADESHGQLGVRRRPPPRESRTDVRVVAYHETGGEIGAVDWPDGMKWRGTLPRVVGIVLDTAGHPAAGASVIISGWQRRDTVTTGRDGHFVSPFLSSSFYGVTAIESMFLGYGNFHGAITSARQRFGETDIEITQQPRRFILPVLCTGQPYLSGMGVVLGRAVNAEGVPAANLHVTASWTVSDSTASPEHSRTMETNADGRFLICGVPLGRAIRFRASTRHGAADVVVQTGGDDVIPMTLTLAPRPSRSEHSVFVRRIGGNGLSDVPELHDSIAHEPEEMDDRGLLTARTHAHARVHRDEISILECVLDIEHLVRILFRVVGHGAGETRPIATEVRVVVPKIRRDVPIERALHLA